MIFAGRTTGGMDDNPRCKGGTGCGCASYSTHQTDSSRCGQQLRDANEIVGDGGQDEEPFNQAAPTMPGLAQTANGLHPPKGFFDPLALYCADAIAGMAGRAREAFGEEHVVRLVQSFSKTVEHSPSYLKEINQLIASRGLGDPEGIAILLRFPVE